MKEMILKMAAPIIVGMITEMITPENLKKYGAKLFSLIEDFVVDSETTVDDKLVLPLIFAARTALGIGAEDE